MFLPSVPNLLGYAAELERQRDHVLGRRIDDEDDLMDAEDALLARAEAGEGGLRRPARLLRGARLAGALRPGALRRREFGHEGEVHVGSEEEMDFLGIPGLLEPDQVRALLHERQRSRRPAAGPEPDDVAEVSTYEQLAVLRRELNGLVAAWHHRTGTAARRSPTPSCASRAGDPPRPSRAPTSSASRILRLREMASRRSS